MKKRIIPFLLLICICCFSFSIATFSSTVYAEGEKVVTIETNAEVEQGSSNYAYVYVNSLKDIATLSISVHYDEDIISIKNLYNSVSCSLYDNSQKDGEISFSYIFDGDGAESKTRLFYFRYQILDSASVGSSIFDITVNEAYNSSLQVIDVSGSRTSFNVIEKKVVSTASVYGTSSISSKTEQEFELSYSLSTYKIASGSIQIQYDKDLFEVVSLEQSAFLNGKIVDVNSNLDGSVYLSFLGTEYSKNTAFCKVRFRTIGNETVTSKIKFVVSEFYDLELNRIQCSGYTTNVNLTYDSVYDDSLSKMYLSSTYDENLNEVNLSIKLSSNSHLGAGDFILQWDTEFLTFSSFEKKLSSTFFNVNDKQAEDGIIKFSIISLSDIVDGGDVLNVVFNVGKLKEDVTVDFNVSGNGLADSLTNTISMNFVDCSQELLAPKPTCKINDISCLTFEEAVLLASENDTIELLADINEVWTANKALFINTNGFALTIKNSTTYKAFNNENVITVKYMPARVIGATLALDGSIGVLFRVNYVDDSSNYNITFNVDNMSVNYSIIDISSNVYTYRIEVAAKQMTSKIQVLINKENESIDVFDYSVRTYIDKTLARQDISQKLKVLLLSMAEYGAKAQAYFNYNTDNLANAGLEEEILNCVSSESIPKEIISSTGNIDGLTFSITLSLESETEILMMIKGDIERIDNLSVSVNGNLPVESIQKTSDGYLVKVVSIPAKNLSDKYTIEIEYEGQTKTIVYGVNIYATKKLVEGNEVLNALLNALYHYNLSAINYFD